MQMVCLYLKSVIFNGTSDRVSLTSAANCPVTPIAIPDEMIFLKQAESFTCATILGEKPAFLIPVTHRQTVSHPFVAWAAVENFATQTRNMC